MAVLSSQANTRLATPGTSKSSNPHKPHPTHRGFVPRGLSDAKRRPKLFTISNSPLSAHQVPPPPHQVSNLVLLALPDHPHKPPVGPLTHPFGLGAMGHVQHVVVGH